MQGTKTVEVAGQVIGPGGPAKNALVILEQPGVDDFGSSRQSRTDEKGIFKLKGIPPGEYRVFASYPASPRSGSLKSDAQLVTLSEHAHKTVQLVMVKPQAE